MADRSSTGDAGTHLNVVNYTVSVWMVICHVDSVGHFDWLL